MPTQSEIGLTMLKGTLVDMPQEDQDKVKAYAVDLRKVMDAANEKGDESHMQLAVSFVGLEMAIAAGA